MYCEKRMDVEGHKWNWFLKIKKSSIKKKKRIIIKWLLIKMKVNGRLLREREWY